MLEKTGMGQSDVVSEIDRYIAWPGFSIFSPPPINGLGQALGYKLGELTIKEVRKNVESMFREAQKPVSLLFVFVLS